MPAPEHAGHVGQPHRVVHVRARLVRHPGPRLVQDVLLVFVQMDAVDRDGTRPQDVELLQPFHHAQVVLAQALVLVGLVLGDVDVEAGAQPCDGSPAGFQRLIRDGERGVQPERRAQLRVAFLAAALDEAHVLGDARARAVHPVAVGDFVAQAGAQPGLFDGVRDDVQAAVDDVRAGVMVDQRRAAVADRIHQTDQRAGAHIIPQQRPVELPPESLQDFHEVGGRRAGDRHAAGERAVEMRVPADGGGQDDFSAGIQALRRRDISPSARRSAPTSTMVSPST